MKTYAGIGSRETPERVLRDMTVIAGNLSDDWCLRSGGAAGADKAFERGATAKRIYTVDAAERLPLWSEAMRLAEKYHPAWGKCSAFVKKLHARNSFIILGDNLVEPVSFVLCYTPHGIAEGGTGQGMRMAADYRIPIFNLSSEEVKTHWMDPLKAALSAWLADREIKLVHVWRNGDRFNAMMEWPYDPVAKKPLPTEKHVTGVGVDAVAAVLSGLADLGMGGLACRLFIIEYLIALFAKELGK